MGQGERIEWINPCPLAPSPKRSLIPQGFRKSLNLHFRPNPILVAVSLALILIISGLVIIWIVLPVWVIDPDYLMHGTYPRLAGGASLVWVLVITSLGAGWRLLSGVREFNKTKTTSTQVGAITEERGKSKHLKTAFLVVLLIVIGVAITPQFAETAGEDSSFMNLGEDSSFMNLEGRRIWIFGEGVPDPPVYTISGDEYAHVYHGWNSKGQYDPKINWSELSEFEMNEFIGTSTFELTINGDPIELSCARWLDMELDVYFVIYYIQFKPGDLATGNHTFIGTWYSEVYGNPYTDETGTCPITLNVTVNVV